jgi:hypothetical protein
LVEALIALSIVGFVVPASLSAMGAALVWEMKIHDSARRGLAAESWFNRLNFPLSPGEIDAMPRTDGSGGLRLNWETEPCGYGAFRVTLRISNGAPDDVPFVESRIF